MAGKFTLKKTDKGNFVFNLKASNGQVILTCHPARFDSGIITSNYPKSVCRRAADRLAEMVDDGHC